MKTKNIPPTIKKNGIAILVLLYAVCSVAQTGTLSGRALSHGNPVISASVLVGVAHAGTTTNSTGSFSLANIPVGSHRVNISAIGFQTLYIIVVIYADSNTSLNINLEEEASSLDEVVVTGVSRATTIRKNPVPIAVVSKKEMDLNVNNNIIDALVKQVPGLSAVTTGPNISKPFIRGLGYNRVLTMYDGMRQEGQQWGDEHGIEIDQYGIERVEVVKGPASLTYGSDALAGVINMIPYIPKAPDGKLTGDMILDYHSNNGMMGSSVGLSYRKNNWTTVFRASGKMAHDYHNNVDGYVYNTAFREYNLSGMITIDRKWGSARIAATLYDNLQEIPDGSRDSLTRKFTMQVNEITNDDLKNRPIVSDRELKTYDISILHQRIQHYRVYTHDKIAIGNGELDLLFGMQQNIRREYNHPTDASQAGLFVILNTYNYDLKYNLPAWKAIETSIGVNGMYQSNTSKNATDFPIPDYRLFAVGSYFFVKKTFGNIDFSGGIRYDSRSVHWDDFYVQKNVANGFDWQAPIADTANASLQFPAFNHRYTGLSGSIGATYNISKRVLLKANLARGYRAPNITEIGSNGLDPGAHIVYLGNRSFKPEFSLQEDIGLLAYLKNIELLIELFNNHIENYIYQAKLYNYNGQPVVIVPGNSTYQYKQSKAQLYGAEISANIHPENIRWLTFNNSLSFVEGLNRNDSLLQKNGDKAKYLPFISPLHTRSEIRASFTKPKSRITKWYARVEMEHYAAQHHFYGVDNTETATAGYVLFNAGCGVTLANRHQHTFCQVFLQADNIFNITYQSNLNRLKYFEYYQSSPTGRYGIYNMGRNMSLKMIVPL